MATMIAGIQKGKAQCKHLDLEMAAKGKGKGKGKGRDKGKGKGLYYSGPWEEPGEEDETCQEESPENDKAEIADDSWWLGSMCALSRECRTHRTAPSMQTKNRFAPLAPKDEDQPDDQDETVQQSKVDEQWPAPCRWKTRAAKTTNHSSEGKQTPIRKRKVTWRCAPELHPSVVAPKVQLLIKESENKVVCAVAKEGVKKGFRLVEAVVDSGAEESVAPPKIFPGKIEASEMSKVGGKYKAANGTRIPNLGQQKVKFRNDDGQMCGMGFQIADVERPLIAASQLAAAGNRVILGAKGGVVEHIKTGRRMMLQRRGGVYVLRMWIAADSQDFPGQGM